MVFKSKRRWVYQTALSFWFVLFCSSKISAGEPVLIHLPSGEVIDLMSPTPPGDILYGLSPLSNLSKELTIQTGRPVRFYAYFPDRNDFMPSALESSGNKVVLAEDGVIYFNLQRLKTDWEPRRFEGFTIDEFREIAKDPKLLDRTIFLEGTQKAEITDVVKKWGDHIEHLSRNAEPQVAEKIGRDNALKVIFEEPVPCTNPKVSANPLKAKPGLGKSILGRGFGFGLSVVKGLVYPDPFGIPDEQNKDYVLLHGSSGDLEMLDFIVRNGEYTADTIGAGVLSGLFGYHLGPGHWSRNRNSVSSIEPQPW